MSVDELLAALPDEHRKHLDPSSPAPMRMMAAKGMAPLPPREMVIVLAGLRASDSDKVANAATTTLAGLPERLLVAALEVNLPGAALASLGAVLRGIAKPSEAVLEKVMLSRATPDETIAALAATAPAGVVEIIANNQERCMRSEAIVDAVRKNPHILRSSLDRLFDFLVRAGVIYEGMSEFAEAIGRLSPVELKEAADKIDLPSDVAAMIEDGNDADRLANEIAEALEDEGEEGHERRRRIPALKLINSLNVAQKVALATKGNKEARAILIRDHNRLVATAAIRNPRVTESEVVAAVQSRSVCDDVIRVVCRSKDMTRNYAVKKALVFNPKAPLPTVMHLLTLLQAADVRDVAKSKNVPTAVANQAKRMVARKK